jgi:cytochrome oxidase Cu insertion factor (SCO1/SenC/PrrC family)
MACRFLILTLCLSPFAVSAQAAQKGAQKGTKAARKGVTYVCVMDPEIKSASPGRCPKCGMLLRRASVETNRSAADGPGAEGNKSGDSVKPPQIPDTTVYDQDGRKLRFYSDLIKGKTVAINFIFTTCTTICPPLTATFRKVQQELAARVGRDVQMVSISVDPATDVPERLKAYSAKFNAGPGWSFITGEKQELDLLLKALGAGTGDRNDHSPMVLVGNESAGYWTRTYGLAPVSTLVKVITDASSRTAATALAQVPMPGTSATASERQVEKRVAAEPGGGGATAGGEAGRTKSPAEAAASYFPNTVLLTQDNKPVHFFDDLLKGKIVLINYMFTTCTGVCPAMTSNLLKVQEYLGERVGAGVNIISISVDPAVDTPEALKKYANNYKVKPGWYFLTGKKEDVDSVLRKVGGFVKDKNDHTSLLIIGNVETGQWMKMFAMSRPAEIADAVIKLADSK